MSDKSAINLARIRAWDAEWDESKHSRADNGQFTSGGGGSGSGSGSAEFIGTKSASKTGKVIKLTSGRKSRIAADLAENYYLGEFVDKISEKINRDNWENGKRGQKDVVDYRPGSIEVKHVRKVPDEIYGGSEAEVTYDVVLEDRSIGRSGKPIKKTITQRLHDLDGRGENLYFGDEED